MVLKGCTKLNRHLCLWLVLLLTAAIAGCGGGAQEGKTKDSDQPAMQNQKDKSQEVSLDQLFAKGKAVPGFTYEMATTVPDGSKMNCKVWVKGGNMRNEMIAPGSQDPVISIINLTDKMVYVYQPQQKIATKMSMEQSEVDTTSPKDYLGEMDASTMKYFGREKYDNKECLVYEVNSADLKGKVWIWEKYGLPLRIESETGGQKVLVEYKNVSVGELDDSLFKLPTDVQVMDLGNMTMPAIPQQ